MCEINCMYTGISIPIAKLVVGHLSLLNLKVFFYLIMLSHVNLDSFLFLLCDSVDRLPSGRKRLGPSFTKRGQNPRV